MYTSLSRMLEATPAGFREPTRIDWRLLLGMTPADRVVDAGSGMGRIGFALARHVAHVDSVESDAGNARFQRLLLQERRESNVTVTHGTLQDLAGVDESADWVLFNGTFRAQSLALQEAGHPGSPESCLIRRTLQLLKPGGHVVIADSNRWKLPFLVHRSGPQPKSFKVATYRSMLAAAGVVDVRVYAVLPHYDAPRAIIPVGQPGWSAAAEKFVLDEVWQRSTRLATLARRCMNLLVSIRLMHRLYPSYLIVGRKP